MRNLIHLDPRHVAELVRNGRAALVDIRTPEDFARGRPKGAVNRPLATLEPGGLNFPGQEVVFTCGTGLMSEMSAERLASAFRGEAFLLKGGLQAWAAAGLPLEEG